MGIGGQVKAVFLDRDGVLNENVFYPDTQAWESPRRAEDFKLFPETVPALQALQGAGFLLFLVSNQPNVAKGKSTMEELDAIQSKLRVAVEAAGVLFTEFFYCYHHPDSTLRLFGGPCLCRKPSPHFLLTAAASYNVDLRQSWMIGDRLSDVACGNRAGARTIFLAAQRPEAGKLSPDEEPSAVASSLSAAVEYLLSRA